ncbi:MAG: adenosylhomocysteinase [Candidatus Eisenbacteria bacterium]|nr:adenosylhomocysteinase [Candidatus Eisenbacteria bacterium]
MRDTASEVKDLSLSTSGKLKIEWASRNMKVLDLISERFEREKPLENVVIGACLHVTSETANLMAALVRGGAKVSLCGSNPLSTQDDVAASLASDFGVSVYAIKGEDNKTYYSHIESVLGQEPDVTMDDGADLVSMLHSEKKGLIKKIIGGTEETSTGVLRLRSMESKGVLAYPIIAVNDADTKHLFDNRYGTGQSTIDGILRCTNMLYAGSTFVVCGYGWCGRGVAIRAKGMGAKVIVCEVDPLRALEALMDGYEVTSMSDAAQKGDVFVTVTGNVNVLRKEHFEKMKDGAVVANSGHFNVEIDIKTLESLSKGKRTVRPFVEEYQLRSGKRINLLGEGRLINLAAAEGHPATVMDMSFANQALSVEYLIKNGKGLGSKVYKVPPEIDKEVARLKLKSLGIAIDELTEEQKNYLSAWELGT